MRYLIINSHPYDGSFNAALRKRIKEELKLEGHEVNEIDLIEDGFNPVMEAEDLKLWGQGKTRDPLVEKYQKEINESDIMIFPFPIWWGTMPAVLKGFCDKVLLPGWAYTYGEKGNMIGALNGKKAIVITTMQTPVNFFEEYFKNPVDGGFVKDTLQTCGIEVLKYIPIDQIVTGGKEYTTEKIEEIVKVVKES